MSVCPIHRCKFLDHCPYSDCGKTLKKHPVAGLCPYCYRKLTGTVLTKIENQISNPDPWLEWVISNCSLLVNPPTCNEPKPELQRTNDNIRSMIDQLGGVASVAQQLDISNKTVSSWYHEINRLVPLKYLLRLSWKSKTPILEALNGDTNQELGSPVHRIRRSRTHCKRSINEKLNEALINISPPPTTLKELCLYIGCSVPTLLKYVPNAAAVLKQTSEAHYAEERRLNYPKISVKENKERVRERILYCLQCKEPLSTTEISKRVGIGQSSFKKCFPKLYFEARDQYQASIKRIQNIRLQALRECALSPSTPPKSLSQIAEELNTTIITLRKLDNETCNKIQQHARKYYTSRTYSPRRSIRKQMSYDEVAVLVKQALENEPPMSKKAFTTKHGASIRRFPDLYNAIGSAYDSYRQKCKLAKAVPLTNNVADNAFL